MITREPTIERLAIAQGLLLEPFGLTEATLAATLAAMGEHRVDDADLYFQTTRHEGWSLEEGIVKSGIFGVACSLIAVYEGYYAIPTAAGVGRATTRTVVTSAVVVLCLDYLLTAAFL